MARASQPTRSASKKPRVECDRRLWPYRDSCRVRVVRIDHNVSVAARGDNGGDDQERRSTSLDPSLAKGLSDRNVERVVPSNVQERIECLPRYIIGNDSFDVACGTRGRFAVGMDKYLNEADSEACPCVDGRESRRVPALAKEAGSFSRPDRM